MVTEGVLPFDLQRFAVKCVVFIKIPANFLDKHPAFLIVWIIGSQVLILHQGNKLRIEDPVYKIIFVLEVIVKALSIHIAARADLRHIDLIKGLFQHQLLQRSRQSPFCDIGICHTRSPPFAAVKKETYLPKQISLVI